MKTDLSHGGECPKRHQGIPGDFVTEGHTGELVWKRLDKAESQSPDIAEALSTSLWLPHGASQIETLISCGCLSWPSIRKYARAPEEAR